MDPLSQIHGLPVQQSASEWDLATCIFRRPRTDIHEPERSDAGDSCRSCHEYRFIKYIGHGVHSSVYEADNRRTGEKVAIKVISTAAAPQNYVKNFLPQEIDVLQRVDHPSCIKTYEIIQNLDKIYIVMELAGNGDMLQYINRVKRIPEERARRYYRQLFDAITYLHSINIAHRDLKCENLLLDDDMNIKVADFGFAVRYADGEMLEHFCGSVAYCCPEILHATPYSGLYSDLWSSAVILFALLSGRLPYQEGDSGAVVRQIKAPLAFPSYLSLECKGFLDSMLCYSMAHRATPEGIRTHPWLVVNTVSAPTSHLVSMDHGRTLAIASLSSLEAASHGCKLQLIV